MARHRFLVRTLSNETPTVQLTGEEFHHLRVRRVEVGDQVVLFDGAGNEADGTVESIGHTNAIIRPSPLRIGAGDPALDLTLAVAVIRPDRLDLVVEKATELGAKRILFFTSDRTRRRVLTRRVARWERIAQEATKQCQRSTLPTVSGPVSFAEVIADSSGDLRILACEDATLRETADLLSLQKQKPTCSSVSLLVGPEGGFSAPEIRNAGQAGFVACSLGRRILRTETAALTALALVQFLWGDLGPLRA